MTPTATAHLSHGHFILLCRNSHRVHRMCGQRCVNTRSESVVLCGHFATMSIPVPSRSYVATPIPIPELHRVHSHYRGRNGNQEFPMHTSNRQKAVKAVARNVCFWLLHTFKSS